MSPRVSVRRAAVSNRGSVTDSDHVTDGTGRGYQAMAESLGLTEFVERDTGAVRPGGSVMKRIVGAVGAIVALAGCAQATDVSDTGLRAVVSVSASQLQLGDTLEVQVGAINTTDLAITTDLGPCGLWFEVLDQAGNVVAPDPPICPLIDFVPTLPPGDSLGVSFSWRGERKPGSGVFLPAGAYRVRGVLGTTTMEVRSAPQTVQLTPR